MADFGNIVVDVNSELFKDAVRKYNREIAALSPELSRCISCNCIKDRYGNPARHFWYHKFTVKVTLYKIHCNKCYWPMPQETGKLIVTSAAIKPESVIVKRLIVDDIDGAGK